MTTLFPRYLTAEFTYTNANDERVRARVTVYETNLEAVVDADNCHVFQMASGACYWGPEGYVFDPLGFSLTKDNEKTDNPNRITTRRSVRQEKTAGVAGGDVGTDEIPNSLEYDLVRETQS